MSYREELIKYLQIPDNLNLAWEIADVMPDVKRHLRQEFWKCVHDRLITKDLSGWTINKPQVSFDNKAHYGLTIQPKEVSEREKLLWVFMMTENDRLWIGIQGNFRHTDLIGLAATRAKELIDDLGKIGYKTTKSTVWSWNWVDDHSDRTLNEKSTLLEIAGSNAFGIEMADVLWDFFEKYRSRLECINCGGNETSLKSGEN